MVGNMIQSTPFHNTSENFIVPALVKLGLRINWKHSLHVWLHSGNSFFPFSINFPEPSKMA